MRLWTLHPGYLDSRGLVAVWREGLLAQKVLAGKTRGYTRHPQLARFRSQSHPLRAMAAFLHGIVEEAGRREYRFDSARILEKPLFTPIEETEGQLLYEWNHLRTKLRTRAPSVHSRLLTITNPDAHPLFRIVPGPIREWERNII